MNCGYCICGSAWGNAFSKMSRGLNASSATNFHGVNCSQVSQGWRDITGMVLGVRNLGAFGTFPVALQLFQWAVVDCALPGM